MATGKQLEVEGLSGVFEESKERESPSPAGDLESPVEAKIEAVNQSLQITNQIETRNKEGPVTHKGNVHSASDSNTETGASSVIAASGSSYDLNCQQCDYKSSCQSHMRQIVKNVHG